MEFYNKCQIIPKIIVWTLKVQTKTTTCYFKNTLSTYSPRASRVLFNREGPKGLWVFLDTLVCVVYGMRSLSGHLYSDFVLFRCFRWYLEILPITKIGVRGNQNGCSSVNIQHKVTHYGLYEMYTTPLSNESKYANFEYLIMSQEVKRSNVFAVA